MVIGIPDDEGNRVQAVGGADGGLALLGLGHLVGVAMVSGDQRRAALSKNRVNRSSDAGIDRLDSFVGGIFDLSAVVYYLTVICLFCYLTAKTMQQRRWA